MTRYQAAWILPIASPPIRDGWLAVDRGRIVAFGRTRGGEAPGPAEDGPAADEADLGQVAVLPGLVNAHTHVELAWLRDAVPASHIFIDWISSLMEQRRRPPDPVVVGCTMAEAITGARRAGTSAVGDISNALASVEHLLASPLSAVVFYELITFNPDDPVALVREARLRLETLAWTDRVRVTLAPHAPYSVAPLLFRAIKQDLDRHPFAPSSVHLGESREEITFLRDGGGAWREFLEGLGAWDPRWVPPKCGPAEFLDRAGFLGARVLAVHGVRLSEHELRLLARRGATLVTCPRSNLHTGAGVPPIAQFYASGVRVAVGTDSLACAPDMNLFEELALMRRLAPEVAASALLDSATRQGARALGFEADLGTLEPGRRAEVIAVDVPDGVDDVEEYLVSGIRPEQVRWVNNA